MTSSSDSVGMNNSSNLAVRKPWGYEYPILETKDLGLWALFLAGDESTSLHCHPKKKTGLAVVTGTVKVSFLNDFMMLGPAGRLMIRPGLFHSSTATTKAGAIMLEIETPRDKDDLVRLEDRYGRKGLAYENADHIFPLPEDSGFIRKLSELNNEPVIFEEVELRMNTYYNQNDLDGMSPKATAIVVRGTLDAKPNQSVLSPGDIVSVGTVQRLWETFDSPNGLELVTIYNIFS